MEDWMIVVIGLTTPIWFPMIGFLLLGILQHTVSAVDNFIDRIKGTKYDE